MNENETLREQMWDLCYGLLTAEEVASLHEQIRSDPVAARLYAEVRLQADLVASAAKVEDASVTLSVPDEGRKVQPAAKKHSGPGESPFKSKSGRSDRKSFRTPSYRAANWLAGLAATALIALIGYGFYAPAKKGSSLSDDQVVATVLGPNSLQSGLTQNLKVIVKTRRGEPASTQLSYQLVSANGSVALRDVIQTDKDGEAQLSLPGLAIQPGCRLEVLAQSEKQIDDRKEANEERLHARRELGAEARKVVVPLAVREEPVTTDVQLEKDSYQGGETVRFRVHSWRSFSNQPAIAAEEWKLVAADGSEIQPKEIQSRPEAGNVTGTFQLPGDAPAGHYRLVGMDPRSGTWQEMEQIVVGADLAGTNFRRAMVADSNRQLQMLRSMDALALAKSEDKGIALNDAKKQAEIKEKREMASAGGFAPTPAPAKAMMAPAPKEVSPEAPLSPPTPKSAAPPGGAPFAAAKSEKEKEKDFTKNDADPSRKGVGPHEEAGEITKKSLNEQLAVQDKKYLRSEQKNRAFDPKERETVQLRGDAVTVQVPAEFAQKKLLAVISKANSTVVTQRYDGTPPDNSRATEFDAKDSRSGGVASELAPAKEPSGKLAKERNSSPEKQTSPTLLSLHLPPEADGEMDVTLFDQTIQPPQPVFKQRVLRESRRGLNIEVAALQQKGADFAPQEELQLRMKATDQNGMEVPQTYFAVRIMKLDDANADVDSGAKQQFAADKMETPAGRGRSSAPAALGGGVGFGGGGGKGSPAKDGAGKEGGKIDDEKRESLEKEDLKRDAQKLATKFKKAEESPAKPDGLAATPPPGPIAGPSGGKKFSGSGPLPPQDDMKQLPEEDRAEAGRPGDRLTFSDEPLAEQPIVPEEVLLGSNDSLIQDAVRADETAAQFATISFRQMIGRAVLLVAAGALLLFGILAVLHRPAQAKVWVPAMAVVAGSFVVGSIWLINGKFAEVAEVPDAAQRPGRQSFDPEMRPMAPATKAYTEPAPAALEPPLAKGMAEDAEATAEATMEKFNENSKGPGIGPTVVLPANSPNPTADQPAAKALFAPGGAGGRGGGIPAEKQPQTEGKPGEAPAPAPAPAPNPAPAPAPAPKPESGAAEPSEPKPGAANRSERAKNAFELKKGDKGQNPQKPTDLKSATLADRDHRTKGSQLLWEPNLPANDKGEAKLNLQLPTEPGDYVLIVDVQGPSGIGTVQKRIPVRVPAPAAPAALPAAPSKP